MKTIILITLLLTSIFCLSNVNADGMESYNFEVQGAKMVSEGAYFYLDIKNTVNKDLNITMYVPFYFEEMWFYDTYGGGSGDILSLYVPFTLRINETKRFHFHTLYPNWEQNETSRIYVIKFKEGYAELWFRVEVLNLKYYTPQQDHEKYILKCESDWWKHKYEDLEEQYLELLEQNNTKLESLETLEIKINAIFVLTVILVFLFITLIFFDLDNYYKIKKLHEKLGDKNER